jgi:hypothetical protein
MSNYLKKEELKMPPVITLLDLRPKMPCVGFQDVELGAINDGEIIENIKLKANQMSVIEMPAPQNAHPWVPDPIRYLEINGPAIFFIEFIQPVYWVEISVAPGKEINSQLPADVSVGFQNSSYNYCASMKHFEGANIVRRTTFTSADLVKVGGGEFEPPATIKEAGDIKEVSIYAGNSNILTWQICYWLRGN